METINEVLNRHITSRTGPTEEKFQATIDNLKQLMLELARPENRDLMRFAIAWQRLEQTLTRIEATISEHVTQKPSDKVNELLKQLAKKK